jgi:transcriptional regulator with XRE-family HTH domain
MTIGIRVVLEIVGAGLIQARKDLKWTQKNLADRLGITEQQIQKLEATKYARARLDTLLRVARALDRTLDDVND